MFTGLKVIELASVLAGPGVGQFFAELGAEVIKVENKLAGGDVTRTWKVAGEKTDDRSAYFCSVNWGKKSVALNLQDSGDRDVVYALVADADVVIASFKPGDAEKLRMDYDRLTSINSRLIYGQVSGYGPKNPRVGYDAVIQAEGGFMFMNGMPGGPSLKMPVAMIDILAGHQLKEGLLLALLQRERNGRGSLVEVSLIQTAVASLANQATNWLVANELPQKHGSAHPNIAPYGDLFKTRDEQEILFAVGNDRQFQDLCRVLESDEILNDDRFKTNILRVENRNVLNHMLQSKIGLLNASDLIPRIEEAKIPAGLIRNLQQVFDTEEAKALLIQSSTLAGVRTIAFSGNGIQQASDLLPPPRLGEHTEEILARIRY